MRWRDIYLGGIFVNFFKTNKEDLEKGRDSLIFIEYYAFPGVLAVSQLFNGTEGFGSPTDAFKKQRLVPEFIRSFYISPLPQAGQLHYFF